MKYAVLLSMVFCLIVTACNDSAEKNGETSSPNAPGVQNVNGNLPDTSNATNLEQPPRMDSSDVNDSVKH